MTGSACRSAKRVLASGGAIASDLWLDMIVTESRFPPRDQVRAPPIASYPSSARASALARRRASRWPKPAETFARPPQGWRRRLLSGSSQQAIDRDVATRQAPWWSVRTWSKPQGTIRRHHGSAVAETGFRRASIALRGPSVRWDISSGNRGMTVQPTNSPYAAHTRRPCRTRLGARQKAAVSQVAGCWAWQEQRCVLAAAVKPMPLAVSLAAAASTPIRPTRYWTAAPLVAAAVSRCSRASTNRVARPHYARRVHRLALHPVRALLSPPLSRGCVERLAHWDSVSDRKRLSDDRTEAPSAHSPDLTAPPAAVARRRLAIPFAGNDIQYRPACA